MSPPTIPAKSRIPVGGDPNFSALVEEARGGVLKTPAMPFTIQVDRPEGQGRVKIQYSTKSPGAEVEPMETEPELSQADPAHPGSETLGPVMY